MLAGLSRAELKQEAEGMMKDNPNDTKLKLDLKDRDPDEGMTNIAYDKGYFFLPLVEETVGRDKFDAFLKKYFQEHKFHSMTTEEFVALPKNQPPYG